MSKWLKNPQPQRTQISTVSNAPFIQNSNWMTSSVDRKRNFCELVLKLRRYSRQRPSFLAYRVALMTKTDLTFPGFSLRFVEFAAQFCFRCKFSFHEKQRSCQVCQWRDFLARTNQNSFAKHSNQWDCVNVSFICWLSCVIGPVCRSV